MSHCMLRYYGISTLDKSEVVYLGLSGTGADDAVARSCWANIGLVAVYNEHELKKLTKSIIDCILVD